MGALQESLLWEFPIFSAIYPKGQSLSTYGHTWGHAYIQTHGLWEETGGEGSDRMFSAIAVVSRIMAT